MHKYTCLSRLLDLAYAVSYMQGDDYKIQTAQVQNEDETFVHESGLVQGSFILVANQLLPSCGYQAQF